MSCILNAIKASHRKLLANFQFGIVNGMGSLTQRIASVGGIANEGEPFKTIAMYMLD